MPPATHAETKTFAEGQSGTVILKSGVSVVVFDLAEVETAMDSGEEFATVVRGDGSGRSQKIRVDEIASIGP